MKQILLLSAAYANGGAYVDAGATVNVGTGKHDITEERAEEIVAGKRAEVIEDASADEVEGEGEDATPKAPAKKTPAR